MTETLMKVIVDCSTGESITVPLTQEELNQREVDRIAYEAQEAERLAEQEAKEKAEASAIAKLTKLGLTQAEIEALKS
jgi:aspartokinase